MTDLLASGWTEARVERELRHGTITRIVRGVYGEGSKPPTPLDVQRATALVTGGVCDAVFTAQLQDWDGVRRWGPRVLVTGSAKRGWTRRVNALPTDTVDVGQVRCLPAAVALRQLASVLDDIHWEQALEFCLRKQLVTPSEVAEWQHARVRRVIKLRGGLLIAPTESLLETLAVQLIRLDPRIPTPTRQLAIYDDEGNFVGRPDLCWPALGIFLELDGQGHENQPVYDAVRQNRIVMKTGWRPCRLTWEQVHDYPEATLRDIAALVLPITVS